MDDLLVQCHEEQPQARLLLLHGWGADASDLVPLGQALCAGSGLTMECLALQAPEPHPAGVGRQWYGLFPPQWGTVSEAVSQLKQRIKGIDQQQIPLSKTVLLGFSQGGAMALDVGCQLPLAGIIACSAYPHPNWQPGAQRPPVVLIHGRNDDVVPVDAQAELARRLNGESRSCRLITFSGGHTIPEGMQSLMVETLQSWLNPTNQDS